MQQQQQGGAQLMGGQTQAQARAPTEVVIGDEHQKLGDLGIEEAASPISSRPPAAMRSHNFEELMRATAASEAGGSSSSSGNRWPRQETLALLQIRSEMDGAFRDATPKGPLWEQVSRKLAELGYKRSGKKCKEKFENVQKYYKRTKEGRAGRQDGKSYKFFDQLEALHHHHNTATPASTSHAPIPVLPTAAISLHEKPMPQAEARVPSTDQTAIAGNLVATRGSPAVPLGGICFADDSSSSLGGEDEEEADVDEMEMDSAGNRQHRKRKRSQSSIYSDGRMMDFFDGLMKQVMQKQEAMQLKFLEAIEKREQDRIIREEAWKRQDMARIAREHNLMAQERAISDSRDASIIAFLQKITGETIHLPTSIPQNTPPPAPLSVPPPSESREHQNYTSKQHSAQHQQQQPTFPHQQEQSQNKRHQTGEFIGANQLTDTSEIVESMPGHQIPPHDFTGGSSSGAASSRWPKVEVLALIQLRSGLESKYQEAGPKGPLWEEISAGMQRLGYNRNAKRCKEKWENINKYYKKVKESNKKRPEDAKTCPYFHELDALYREKLLGNTSGGGGSSIGTLHTLSEQERQQQHVGMPSLQLLQFNEPDDKSGGKTELQSGSGGAFSSDLFGEQSQGTTGGAKQPEDILKKQHQDSLRNMIEECFNKVEFSDSDDTDDQDHDEDNYIIDTNEHYNDKAEEDMEMSYEMQYQRQNIGSSSGRGTSSTSLVAVVR